MGSHALLNTFRRFRQQVLFVVPPFLAAYAALNWATDRYEFWGGGRGFANRTAEITF